MKGREAVDREELLCEREPHNDHDRYAVAMKKKGGIHVLVSFGRFA